MDLLGKDFNMFKIVFQGKPLWENADYKDPGPFTYSNTVQQYLVNRPKFPELHPELFDKLNVKRRQDFYIDAITKLTEFSMYKNVFNIKHTKHNKKTMSQLYKYIIELIPANDLLVLYTNDPRPPISIYFQAAAEYDPPAYQAAVKELTSGEPVFVYPERYLQFDTDDADLSKLNQNLEQILSM